MPAATRVKKRRFNPPLRKKYLATHEGFDVYAVNAFAVRNVAEPDEEFTNIATKDEFPDLIPEGEIWISDRNVDKEGVFFIANALTRMKRKAGGAPDGAAYTAGLDAERALRRKLNGVKFRAGRPHKRVPERLYVAPYLSLHDPKFPVHVRVVDGNLVRSYYKTDYTEGGHGYVYRWVPKGEIWIETDLDRRELPFIVSHEYIELRLMRDEGMEYDPAHEICVRLEFLLRKRKGAFPLLASGRSRLRKQDLHRLTSDEMFHYVCRTYLKR